MPSGVCRTAPRRAGAASAISETCSEFSAASGIAQFDRLMADAVQRAPLGRLVDIADVYMSFFLPEMAAGRVALGSEVRIVLDAAPQYIIPARVSFVASTAQFTPKTVETASERQKLMFRVRAQIDRELLQRHIEQVKTGLPGVAWVRLDAAQPWPASLANVVQP